jgi:hypothetical protein
MNRPRRTVALPGVALCGWLLVLSLGGCAAAEAVVITSDRALTEHGDVELGWGVERDSLVVRWHECAATTLCGRAMRERPLSELQAVDEVGQGSIDDDSDPPQAVQVERLHFAPPPLNRPTDEVVIRQRMRAGY